MIKAFLRKAGKKLRQITGPNKKQDKKISLPSQAVQEDQQKRAGSDSGKKVQTSGKLGEKSGKYRRPSSENRSKKPR